MSTSVVRNDASNTSAIVSPVFGLHSDRKFGFCPLGVLFREKGTYSPHHHRKKVRTPVTVKQIASGRTSLQQLVRCVQP